MNALALLRVAAVAALLLAACADTSADPPASDPTVATTKAPTTTTPTPPTTTTTLPPTTTTTQPPTTTTTASPTTTTLAPTTTTTLAPTTAPGPPPTTAIEHGAFAWAVYLGLWDAPPDEADRAAAAAPAEAVGYEVEGWGEAGCDQGAADALGLDPNDLRYVSSLYFASEADAQAAAAAIGDGVLAVAEVQTFCLD